MGLQTETLEIKEKMTSKERKYPEQQMETDDNLEISENNVTDGTNIDIAESNNILGEAMTPPPMPVLNHPINVRNAQDRPHSAHLHRITGRLLRAFGDQYQCNSCGRTLRTLGDEMTNIYALRRAMSSGELQNLMNTPKR